MGSVWRVWLLGRAADRAGFKWCGLAGESGWGVSLWSQAGGQVVESCCGVRSGVEAGGEGGQAGGGAGGGRTGVFGLVRMWGLAGGSGCGVRL